MPGSMSGMWKRRTVWIMRHRQTKGPDTDRPDLNNRATSRLYSPLGWHARNRFLGQLPRWRLFAQVDDRCEMLRWHSYPFGVSRSSTGPISQKPTSRSLSGIRKHKLGLAVGDTLSSAKIGSGKPGAPHFCLRTHARPFFAAYAGLFPLGSLRHLQGSP